DPERLARAVAYPCVLKPLTLSASRGVIRADDPAGFVAAFQRIAAILRGGDVSVSGSAAEHLLVEAFVPGREVALEGLLLGGRLRDDDSDPARGSPRRGARP